MTMTNIDRWTDRLGNWHAAITTGRGPDWATNLAKREIETAIAMSAGARTLAALRTDAFRIRKVAKPLEQPDGRFRYEFVEDWGKSR